MEHGNRASAAVTSHVRKLELGDLTDIGEDANKILDAVHRSTSLDILLPLYESENVECTRSLAFILKELGLRSIEAMDWLDSLLDSDDEYVVHHAVTAIQMSGSMSHGRCVARAISKIEDSRPARFAVVRFLSHGSIGQISTAIPHLDGELKSAVAWLADSDFRGWRTLHMRNGVAPLVAVAAAIRLSVKGDSTPLDHMSFDRRKEISETVNFVVRFTPIPPINRDILYRMT